MIESIKNILSISESYTKTSVFARSCEENIIGKIMEDSRKMYYCNSDFCNSVSSSSITTFTLISSIILPLLIF